MQELKCLYCGHARRRHSMKGCTHTRKNMKSCTCNEPFMNKSSFEMGEPKDD